jgi:tetratricopeptide (TPR) repeat protein/DNA-binding CsgD family transcriptional regulator
VFRYFLFIFLTVCFAYSQDSSQLSDSIFKYKHTNPSLALEYGIEYSNQILNKKPDSELQQVLGAIGEILSVMGLNATALDYLKRSIKLYEALPEKERKFPEIDQPPGVLLIIGNIYFSNGDYDKADDFFTQTISLYEKTSDQEAKFFGINTAMSNRALIKQVKKDYNGAEKIFRDVYQRRKEFGKAEDILYSMNNIVVISLLKNEIVSAENTLSLAENFYIKEIKSANNNPLLKRNMGYVVSSFGAIMQYKKQFKKAIFYLNESKTYLKDFPMDIVAIGSRLAECHLGLNNLEEAENIAIKNLEFKNLNEKEKQYNYKVLEKIYKAKNLNSKLLQVKDSLILMTTGLPSLKTIKSLNNLETEIQLATSARELNESKIKYNTYLYILIICSVILFFSLMTIRINYNLQKEKGTRLQLEKNMISVELDQKNRELMSKSNFIIQRNEYLKKIRTKLELSEESPLQDLKSASHELNSVINSEKSYKEFDKLFANIYPDFYTKLNKIATLSTTDLRLASYIKMNHTNSEISIISGVSTRTIESQRYRISKKLNLEKDQSLNSFINNI